MIRRQYLNVGAEDFVVWLKSVAHAVIPVAMERLAQCRIGALAFMNCRTNSRESRAAGPASQRAAGRRAWPGWGWSRASRRKKIELAPARKQSACSSSLIASRPAESRTNDAGIMIRATAMVRTKSSGSSGSRVGQRRSLDAHQHVDRHALGMLGQVGQGAKHGGVIFDAFAHTQDAAAADADARFAHAGQRVQPVLVGAGA